MRVMNPCNTYGLHSQIGHTPCKGLKASFFTLSLLLPLLFANQGRTADWSGPGDISIIYIESNTGDSSGGHAALRTGTHVFHFQHGEDGLLMLHRERWKAFRYYYNDLGNRNMHEAVLAFPREVTQQIWQHLTCRLIEQDIRISRLHDLQDDVKLTERLSLASQAFAVRGYGLFIHKPNSGGRESAGLRQEIAERFGADFLRTLRHAIATRLAHLPYSLEDRSSDSDTAISRHSTGAAPPHPLVKGMDTPPSPLKPYREQLALYAAITVLDTCMGVDPSLLIAAPPWPEGSDRLSPGEKTEMERYRNFFKQSIISLLESKRPDRGFPLLLATARYLAATRSIDTNRLIMLDTHPAASERVNAIRQAGSQAILNGLMAQNARRLVQERSWVLSDRRPYESDWCTLENMVSRLAELWACTQGRQKMRVYPGTAVPSRRGEIKIPNPPKRSWARDALLRAERRLSAYRKLLNREMGYNLFCRNCVTELFKIMSEALHQRYSGIKTHAINPDEIQAVDSMSFIPWQMFRQVTDRLHPKRVILYASWRNRHIDEMYSHGNPIEVYLKECNTITSSIYRNGRQDSAFLMFTDDNVFTRPLFGAINIAWSVPRICAGLLYWPFDSGYLLGSGAEGALFSLPELFFINIRKGNFALN